MTAFDRDNADGRSDATNRSNLVQRGFADPSGAFPRSQYLFEPSVNRAARNRQRNELITGGGVDGLSVEVPIQQNSQYPYNQVWETQSGHVLEFDDTPGGQRILIRHNTGSGVELRSDGSIVMVSQANMITSIAGSAGIIVEGDAEISARGNLSLSVAGDLNIDVGGNINVTAGGNKVETINGASRETVYGTKSTTVRGSRRDTTVGTVTRASLGGVNEAVQGNMQTTVQGNNISSASGQQRMSGAGEVAISSPNVNMAASNLSVFGASGTIGGAGVVMYSQTSYATTFHGDLNGVAKEALLSDETNFQNFPAGDVGSKSGMSMTNDGTATAQPTADVLSDYLNAGGNGVTQVTVDQGDFIRNSVDRTVENAGISTRPLNTREIRSTLREPSNRSNNVYTGNMVASGRLSPTFRNPIPPSIGRVDGPQGSPRMPAEPLNNTLARIERFTPNRNTNVTRFDPDPAYDVNNIAETTPINGQVRLSRSVRLARFLGGTGDRVTLDHISTREEKLQIARQFLMQAEAVEGVIQNRGEFANHRLIVVEGLYQQGPSEQLTEGSVNQRATQGRTVVYELHNSQGQIDAERTYDLAVFWKDTLLFDELILDYDTYDPSGELNAQVILIMPEIDAQYNLVEGRYRNQIKTLFNGEVLGNELIEVGPTGEAIGSSSNQGITSDLQQRIDGLNVSEDRRERIAQFIEANPQVDWVPVEVNGEVLMVSNDYLRNADGSYIRAGTAEAAAIAESRGARLPRTTTEVDAIHQAASIRPGFRASGGSSGFAGEFPSGGNRDRLITLHDNVVSGIRPQRGDLVSGQFKTIMQGGIYHGVTESGSVVQPFGNPHSGDYVDYSQGIRLIANQTF